MRPGLTIASVALALVSSIGLAHAQTATLRTAGDVVSVEVDLGGKINPTAVPIGGIYAIRENGWTQVAQLSALAPPYQRFSIAFPPSPDPNHYDPNPKIKYKVVLFGKFTDPNGKVLAPAQTLDVTTILIVKLDKDLVNCGAGRLRLLAFSPDASYDWRPYLRYLQGIQFERAPLGKLSIRKIGGSKVEDFIVSDFEIVTKTLGAAQASQKTIVCINHDIPSAAFTAKLELNSSNRPPDVGADPSASEIAGDFSQPPPKSTDITAPEKRKLERNLDVGLSFTSSVAEQTVPASGTTPAATFRKRTNRGVLDLRFAPWINVLHPVIERDTWLHFLTPFFINANVSTGKITKDTLSLNRILLGLEAESRFYKSKTTVDKSGKKRTSFPIWHRVIYGLTHASDRDFKQDEFTGKIEYAPIFEALYRPYALNYYIDRTSGEPTQRWYGFTFKPKVGFEMGRTYRRHNPAPDVKPSDTVRRVYLGTDLTFNLSKHLTLAPSNIFYIRGETPKRRMRNYFKGQADFIFNPDSNIASGLFLAFERGQLAPFTSPDVNSVRVGFRVLGDFCEYFCR